VIRDCLVLSRLDGWPPASHNSPGNIPLNLYVHSATGQHVLSFVIVSIVVDASVVSLSHNEHKCFTRYYAEPEIPQEVILIIIIIVIFRFGFKTDEQSVASKKLSFSVVSTK